MGGKCGFRTQTGESIQFPALLLPRCDLSKLLYLPWLQSDHPYKAENNTYSKECWEILKGKGVHSERLVVTVIVAIVTAGLTSICSGN